ncbi:hypothetical protein OH76DRAFT_1395603 [Lentinus brumalis]|uniref:Uncharacterized protein n=1 Tax=Lentinus brumalis TaxID=2498619 RepID=A0A371DVB7_9APHY|nr:hypothetical protein OH76DRAFT_1395603 [Polyporus brumalis]
MNASSRTGGSIPAQITIPRGRDAGKKPGCRTYDVSVLTSGANSEAVSWPNCPPDATVHLDTVLDVPVFRGHRRSGHSTRSTGTRPQLPNSNSPRPHTSASMREPLRRRRKPDFRARAVLLHTIPALTPRVPRPGLSSAAYRCFHRLRTRIDVTGNFE